MAEPKEYQLSKEDQNLLTFVTQHQQAIFSGILSTIALKFGVQVGEHTQFVLSPDMSKVTISEIDPQAKQAPAAEQNETAETPVKAAE